MNQLGLPGTCDHCCFRKQGSGRRLTSRKQPMSVLADLAHPPTNTFDDSLEWDIDNHRDFVPLHVEASHTFAKDGRVHLDKVRFATILPLVEQLLAEWKTFDELRAQPRPAKPARPAERDPWDDERTPGNCVHVYDWRDALDQLRKTWLNFEVLLGAAGLNYGPTWWAPIDDQRRYVTAFCLF